MVSFFSLTGACLTFGHGKQCIIFVVKAEDYYTQSSTNTEPELVGVDDAMTFVLWMKHFLQARTKKSWNHLLQSNPWDLIELSNRRILLDERHSTRTEWDKIQIEIRWSESSCVQTNERNAEIFLH